MTSDRLRDAVAELDAFRGLRARGNEVESDLFTALDNVLEHAGDQWKDQALENIRNAALAHRELTIDDIEFPATIDNRARGSVMLIAARRKWIKNIGNVGGGAGRHARPITLWASNLYGSPR